MTSTESMTTREYREEQARWVSGHRGSSYADIVNVIAVSLSFVWLWRCLQLVLWPRTRLSFWTQFIAEYAVIVIPSLISMTYADYAFTMNLVAVLVGFIVYWLAWTRTTTKDRVPLSAAPSTNDNVVRVSRKPWLSIYRALLMLHTCAAILAVDFPVFPRRFAKVETFGVSLMDLGVGAVVFSSGVVAARSFVLDASKTHASLLNRLKRSLYDSTVLLLLGFARLLAVKGTEYQEHVTEYGVHWNFFFTLGCLPVLVALFQGLTRSPGLVGISIVVAYQCALTYWHGETYILEAPRDNLISMNREGLFSIAGYLAIFLLAMDIGKRVLPDAKSTVSARDTTVRLALQAIGFWLALAGVTHGWGVQVSRRMTNLPYVLWVVAFSLSFMTLLHVMELALNGLERVRLYRIMTQSMSESKFKEKKQEQQQQALYRLQTPIILDAINQHSMKIFLLANLLTGLVNFSMRTIYASSITAMSVLSLYLLFICLVAARLVY